MCFLDIREFPAWKLKKVNLKHLAKFQTSKKEPQIVLITATLSVALMILLCLGPAYFEANFQTRFPKIARLVRRDFCYCPLNQAVFISTYESISLESIS